MSFNLAYKRITESKGASRLAINTIIIYGQGIISALLSLITTPLILNTLGVEDYGIYTLTIGLVSMIAFLNWSLSSTTQRYLAFALGENKIDKLKQIFSSSILIHVLYGFIIFLLISTLGVIFIDKLLNIPAARIEAAKTVLVLVSIIAVINIFSIPFTGLFRAHENFLYLAVIGIIESFIKLGIAIFLLYISYDRLIFYSITLLIATVLIVIVHLIVSKRLYPELNFKISNLNKKLILEMISFLGWSFLGAIAILSRNQAVSVLINMFFGVVTNAAYGIAMQINAAVGILSQGIIAAISPRIVKLAGSGDNQKMVYLMRTMSKLSVLIVSIVVLPLLFEASFILKLWLRSVPEDAVLFSKLILGFGLLTLLSAGIQQVFDAIGKVRSYNISISFILILNIPISYILFRIGFPSYSIIIVGMILETISLFVRLFLLKRYLDFSIVGFLKDVFIKITSPIFFSIGLVIVLRSMGNSELQQSLITLFVFLIVYPVLAYFIALDIVQKLFFRNLFYSIKSSLKIM